MSWIITYPPEYYLQLGGHSSIVPTETRYIATLKASEGGYIKLAQPIDIGANDDFEITYVFATDTPAYSVLIGNGTTSLFRIEPNGELRAYCGMMSLTSTIIVNDGKLHTATVKRIGNVFSLKVDNENELSVATVSVFSELIFEEITKHGTSYSNVTPLELKSTTLNTLTHHYDFNVAKGTTIIPNLAQPSGNYDAEYINVTDDNKELYTFDEHRNAWVGAELWDNSIAQIVNTGTSNSTFTGSVAHIQTGGDYTGIRVANLQTVGYKYLFNGEAFDVIDSGSGYLTLGESYGDGRNTPITPKLDAIFKADTTYAQVKRAQGSYDLKLRNISFRHILEVAQ